jgi:RND family efflux transporter MFP subunit
VDIGAREGNAISRGDLLVRIDPDKIGLALDAKRAQVAQARATAELAKKELERSRNLREQDLVSEGGFDAALAEHTRAQGLYDQYVAEMKQLELDLENCSIRAPFDGYTGRQLVDPGEWVNPGTPVYEVVDLNTIKVIVDLPERHFGEVDKGSTVSIRVSGESDATVTGVVTGIAPAASEVTHTFPVIIAVDNGERRLGGGMLVRTTLSLSGVFTSLAVSKDAIVRQGNQTMVYTIDDGKAAPIPVQTSSTEGEMIAIAGDGLAEGMPVIVRGNERVFPGSPVRTPGGPSGGNQPGAGAADGDEDEEAGDETAEADTQNKG